MGSVLGGQVYWVGSVLGGQVYWVGEICIFLSVDVGIRQKICSRKLHSSGGRCVSGSGMCI